jgi:hypothetical protein
MNQFMTSVKAVCGKLFAGFLQSRLLAELPARDEILRKRTDHQSDDPRTGGGVPVLGVL